MRRTELVNTVAGLLEGRVLSENTKTNGAGIARPETLLALKVLLAEDNPVNQVVATEYLANLGCNVTVVENGLQAVAACEREHFDVVLMDHQMPEMDGITAARIIREREIENKSALTPIIAVTANAFAEDREKGANVGMVGYLSKPFSEDQLCEALQTWAQRASKATPVAAAPAQIPSPKTTPPHDSAFKHARPGLHERLVRVYLDHAPITVANLPRALRLNDALELKMAAHSLKSSSANVGANDLAELCRQLELAANENNLETCKPLVNAIQVSFLRVASKLSLEQAALEKTKVA